MIYDSILDTIGETPIVRLQHVKVAAESDVLVKVEGTNPGGSIKDRPAGVSGSTKPGTTRYETAGALHIAKHGHSHVIESAPSVVKGNA